MKDKTKIDQLVAKYIGQEPYNAYKIAEEADKSEVRILDKTTEKKAVSTIFRAKKSGNTLGGIFEVVVTGLPIGLGSYVHFDRKLDGLLAQALMSIQAIKGVEIRDGFANATKYGSEVNDEFIFKNGKIRRKTNRAGGIEGGVTNSEMIILHAAMKPISTLAKPLQSIDLATGREVDSRYERSDVCAVPAASVIGEAVIAPVLANAFLEKYGGDSLKEIKSRYRPR